MFLLLLQMFLLLIFKLYNCEIFHDEGIIEYVYSAEGCAGEIQKMNFYMKDYCYYTGSSYRYEYTGSQQVTLYECPGNGCKDCSPVIVAQQGECISSYFSYSHVYEHPQLQQGDYYEKVYYMYINDCTVGFAHYTFYPNRKCTINDKIGVCTISIVNRKIGYCYLITCDGLENPKACSGSNGNCTDIDTCECNYGFIGSNCEFSLISSSSAISSFKILLLLLILLLLISLVNF